jgi:3-hydroxybutyryl-CoA dehydratase
LSFPLFLKGEGTDEEFIHMTQGKSIHELNIGDSAELSKTVTAEDTELFAKATGDFNPVHLDEAYAEKTIFKGRIAHGLLSLGFISAILGNILPGHGAIYLSQEVKFLAPVRIGDTITARVEVTELIPEKNRVKFRTTCINQEGKIVVDGTAWAMPPTSQSTS